MKNHKVIVDKGRTLNLGNVIFEKLVRTRVHHTDAKEIMIARVFILVKCTRQPLQQVEQ
jgi:hypothetical protein